uniref:Transmembrane protein n=1 Tax=Solanum lycopersicum TaxID=4081 RepID=A0A3Q7H4Z0_SOLLC
MEESKRITKGIQLNQQCSIFQISQLKLRTQMTIILYFNLFILYFNITLYANKFYFF